MLPFNEARVSAMRAALAAHLRDHKSCKIQNCEGGTQAGADAALQVFIDSINTAEAKAQADGVLGNWTPPEPTP
jgi:hypothetical protein